MRVLYVAISSPRGVVVTRKRERNAAKPSEDFSDKRGSRVDDEGMVAVQGMIGRAPTRSVLSSRSYAVVVLWGSALVTSATN
jgi:hypothetical protein